MAASNHPSSSASIDPGDNLHPSLLGIAAAMEQSECERMQRMGLAQEFLQNINAWPKSKAGTDEAVHLAPFIENIAPIVTAFAIGNAQPTYQPGKISVNWLILLRGRIQDNDGHWGSDQRIMNFIFASTKDKAQEMLVPYFSGEDTENDFVNSVQMVNHLIASHRSSTLQRDSMVQFEALRQGTNESFQNFKTRFLSLAGKARIHHSLRKDLMYERMNRQLKLAVYTQLHNLSDFNALCQFAEPVDKERIRLEKYALSSRSENKPSTKKLYLPESTTTALNRRSEIRQDTREERKSGSYLICYHCKKSGHTKSECPNKMLNERHAVVQVLAEESSGTDSCSCPEDEVDRLNCDGKGKEES